VNGIPETEVDLQRLANVVAGRSKRNHSRATRRMCTQTCSDVLGIVQYATQRIQFSAQRGTTHLLGRVNQIADPVRQPIRVDLDDVPAVVGFAGAQSGGISSNG
jgi:hypothetical protein